jgi:drug/metabolite transporter (DMT)-like permease
MATKMWAITLVILMTALTSAAQLLYKAGVAYFPQYIDWRIIAGLALYVMGAVMLLFAFKGGEVTVLYPIIATSFAWVAIFSWILFGESLNLLKIGGIFLIIAGITILGFGSQKKKNKKTRARRKR